jgi:hypothetical protein
VFIASDLYEILSLGTEERKMRFKIEVSIPSNICLLAPHGRRKIEQTFCE